MRSAAPAMVDLSAAEVRLPPPAVVRAAVDAHLAEPSTYAEPAGDLELRARLVGHLRSTGVPCQGEEQVAVTAGATAALAALVSSQTPPGGTVLVPDPGWGMYRRLVETTGRRPRRYPVPDGAAGDDAWRAEVERIAAGADALIWNSPHNPTGRVATGAQCAAVARLASRHGLFLISDEVLSDLTWTVPHTSPLPAADPERRAGVWSASKSLRLTGHRVGWLWGSERTASAAAYVAWSQTMGAPTPGQVACRAALSARSEVVAESRALIHGNLERMVSALAARADFPQAGMALWLDLGDTGLSGTEAATRLAGEYGLRVRAGESFGPAGAGRVRLNAGAGRRDVDDALDRLTGFLDDLPATGLAASGASRITSPT
jgi:aspartate/methionine/tyrosine aminotransferase